METKVPILQSIIGSNTALPDNQLQEYEMGLVDFIYLGLIPIELDKSIRSCIQYITKKS